MNDAFILGRHNFFLLDEADIVFKRELPVDRWHMLCHSVHPMLPTRRIRRQPRWQARLAKIRPIALPTPGKFPGVLASATSRSSIVRTTPVTPESRRLPHVRDRAGPSGTRERRSDPPT